MATLAASSARFCQTRSGLGKNNRAFGKTCLCPLPKSLRRRFDENGANDELPSFLVGSNSAKRRVSAFYSAF